MADFEELKQHLDIVKVASQYTQLKEIAQGSYQGLCPLHDERTPSFRVDANKGLYYCFGCSKGGDVLSLLHHKESIPYSEIFNFAKVRFNLPIEQHAPDQEKTNQLDSLRVLMSLVTQEEYRMGQEYVKGRVPHAKDLEKYRVFTFTKRLEAAFLEKLSKDRVLTDAALTLSVVYRSTDGSLYSPFVNRVVFPLMRHTVVVGLNGRATSEHMTKKYLLTRKGKAWTKKSYIYGADWARNVARETDVTFTYVTEGVLDAISLIEADVPAVCVLGSSVSTEQFTDLNKSFDSLYLALDMDNAGVAGVKMSLYSAFKDGIPLSGFVISMEDGKDAADMLKDSKGSTGIFTKLKKRAFEDIIIDQYIVLSRKSLANPDDVEYLKKKVLNKISETLYDYKTNPFSKSLILRLSERMGYKPEYIFSVMDRSLEVASTTATKIFNATNVETFSQIVDIADIRLLRLIHSYPALYDEVKIKDWFASLNVHTRELLEIIVQRDSDPKVDTVELINRKTKIDKKLKKDYQQILIMITKFDSGYDWKKQFDFLDSLYSSKMDTQKHSVLVHMVNKKKNNLRGTANKISKTLQPSDLDESRKVF